MIRYGSSRMAEREIRDALNRHWAASDENDFCVEHDIYRDDALLAKESCVARRKDVVRGTRDEVSSLGV
jgi:hypothetical protein